MLRQHHAKKKYVASSVPASAMLRLGPIVPVGDENHNQGAGACNIESPVGDIGWWGGITTIVDIYDDKKRNFGFKNIR